MKLPPRKLKLLRTRIAKRDEIDEQIKELYNQRDGIDERIRGMIPVGESVAIDEESKVVHIDNFADKNVSYRPAAVRRFEAVVRKIKKEKKDKHNT